MVILYFDHFLFIKLEYFYGEKFPVMNCLLNCTVP